VDGSGDNHVGWRDLFTAADALSPAATAEEKRRRGREFEKILERMLAEAGLDPRIRFRPAGEEVDGSFFHRERVMLLEAKWTAGPQPASSIYQFRGKVDGKLTGTIGVFISMSGYSEDAVEALIAGKVLNVILFDGDDMRAVASRQLSFPDALDRKLRDAAENGTPFSPLRDPVSRQTLYRGSGPGRRSEVRAVIVEGRFDAVLVHALADVLGPPGYQLEVVPAGGVANLGALAGIAGSTGLARGLTVIADGDGNPDAIRRRVESELADRDPDLARRAAVIVLDPSFEAALGITDGLPAGRRDLQRDLGVLNDRLRDVDVPRVAARDPEVRRLLENLGLGLPGPSGAPGQSLGALAGPQRLQRGPSAPVPAAAY
jgi:hypothetical protein